MASVQKPLSDAKDNLTHASKVVEDFDHALRDNLGKLEGAIAHDPQLSAAYAALKARPMTELRFPGESGFKQITDYPKYRAMFEPNGAIGKLFANQEFRLSSVRRSFERMEAPLAELHSAREALHRAATMAGQSTIALHNAAFEAGIARSNAMRASAIVPPTRVTPMAPVPQPEIRAMEPVPAPQVRPLEPIPAPEPIPAVAHAVEELAEHAAPVAQRTGLRAVIAGIGSRLRGRKEALPVEVMPVPMTAAELGEPWPKESVREGATLKMLSPEEGAAEIERLRVENGLPLPSGIDAHVSDAERAALAEEFQLTDIARTRAKKPGLGDRARLKIQGLGELPPVTNEWRGQPLEPAATRLHLSALPATPIDVSQPITATRRPITSLSGTAKARAMKLPPAAAPRFAPLENYRAELMGESSSASLLQALKHPQTSAIPEPVAPIAEAVEEIAERPKFLQGLRDWAARSFAPKTLEQRLPKIAALSNSPMDRRILLRAVDEGRLAVDPHLPFDEIASRADHLGPYDAFATLKASEGTVRSHGADFVAGNARLFDAEHILAHAKPVTEQSLIPHYAPIEAAPLTAAELEAEGQMRLRFPQQTRVLSDKPFGPPKPTGSAVVVAGPLQDVTEVAETVEAARPNIFARAWSRFTGLFTPKGHPAMDALSPDIVRDAAAREARRAAAETAARAAAGTISDEVIIGTSGAAKNQVVLAAGGGGAGTGAGARATSAAGESARAGATATSAAVETAEKGGRTGLIIAGALATVGGVAYLTGGGHQKREYQRRLDAAAVAPDQVQL